MIAVTEARKRQSLYPVFALLTSRRKRRCNPLAAVAKAVSLGKGWAYRTGVLVGSSSSVLWDIWMFSSYGSYPDTSTHICPRGLLHQPTLDPFSGLMPSQSNYGRALSNPLAQHVALSFWLMIPPPLPLSPPSSLLPPHPSTSEPSRSVFFREAFLSTSRRDLAFYSLVRVMHYAHYIPSPRTYPPFICSHFGARRRHHRSANRDLYPFGLSDLHMYMGSRVLKKWWQKEIK